MHDEVTGVLVGRKDPLEVLQPSRSRWDLSDGYRVLDNPVRRLILNLLNENGPMEYRRLAILIQARSKNISYHLLVLRPYVVKNEDGLFELNDLGLNLAKFVSNGKKVLNVSDRNDVPE